MSTHLSKAMKWQNRLDKLLQAIKARRNRRFALKDSLAQENQHADRARGKKMRSVSQASVWHLTRFVDSRIRFSRTGNVANRLRYRHAARVGFLLGLHIQDAQGF